MDSKMIERVLSEILSIDQAAKSQLDQLEAEIVERELQLNVLSKDLEEGSHKLEKQYSERINERVQSEWGQKIDAIKLEGEETIKKHQEAFEAAITQMVEKAIEEMEWWK